MDAVLLALASAFLFGAMTVAIRIALGRGALAEGGSLFTVLAALAVTLPVAAFQGGGLAGTWPFLLAGLLAPGLSQLLFTLAVREAGPSRTSVVVGTAPLFSVAIALVFLDEPLEAGLVAGAVLIVAGGLLLVGERDRPEHVRVAGLALALVATVVFAARDNLVRWLAVDTEVAPGVAAAATLGAGAALIAAYFARDEGAAARVRSARVPPRRRALRALVRLPLRGVLPRARDRRLAARRHGVAVGSRALGDRARTVRAGRRAARRRRAPRRLRRRPDRVVPLEPLLERLETLVDPLEHVAVRVLLRRRGRQALL